jgi:hypothetical protein
VQHWQSTASRPVFVRQLKFRMFLSELASFFPRACKIDYEQSFF